MSAIRERKKFFIKPGFQSRLTAILVLMVVIVANFVGALVYALSITILDDTLVQKANFPIDSIQLGQMLLPGIILAQLISIFIVAFICIFVTHTIAGPVYRMEKVVRSIGEGDLTNFIKLRPKDELKDLADAMNEMTMGIRNKVSALKDSALKVQEGVALARSNGSVEQLDGVLKSLSEMGMSLEAFVLEKEPE